MARALLVATAGREELSAPNAMLVQPGTAVARDSAVEGSGGTVPIRSWAGQGRDTRFTILCLELSETLFHLSFSLLPLSFTLSRSRPNFYFVYFCSCMLAWRAFFLSPLIKCIPHGYDLTDTEQS